MNRLAMHLALPHADGSSPWIAVRALGDIEYLVKESEVLTGRAGRCFVVAGADRLAYRVHWHPLGFKVDRLDDHGHVLSSSHLSYRGFAEHPVALAMTCGQLFTPSVPREATGTD